MSSTEQLEVMSRLQIAVGADITTRGARFISAAIPVVPVDCDPTPLAQSLALELLEWIGRGSPRASADDEHLVIVAQAFACLRAASDIRVKPRLRHLEALLASVTMDQVDGLLALVDDHNDDTAYYAARRAERHALVSEGLGSWLGAVAGDGLAMEAFQTGLRALPNLPPTSNGHRFLVAVKVAGLASLLESAPLIGADFTRAHFELLAAPAAVLGFEISTGNGELA